MLRTNTKQEIAAIVKAGRRNPNKLIYYCLRNKSPLVWCSMKAFRFENFYPKILLYSLKHPSKKVKNWDSYLDTGIKSL